MAAELNLDPLPEDEWVHGEEAPTDGTDDFGDTNFTVPEAITYTVAQVIEEMIDALQARRDYIQLPRWSFAFGIGTGGAAGALTGLADNQEEVFSFVARPVIDHAEDAGGRYLARYLKRGGNYIGAEDAIYNINFTAEGGAPGWSWQWNFGPWTGPFPFSWLEQEMDDGITIQWVNSAGPSWIMPPAITDDTEWIIKAYTKLRRTDHAIAYVLLTELMDALEETVLGNDDASIDFGEGLTRAKIFWTSPTYDDYEGKFLIYDTDVERLSGFESIPPIGARPASDDRLKKGMEGAIMQIRGMLNDLRRAMAVEIPPISDAVGTEVLELHEQLPLTDERVLIGDNTSAPGLEFPETFRKAVQSEDSFREDYLPVGGDPIWAFGLITRITSASAAVGLRVVALDFPIPHFEYEAYFYHFGGARIFKYWHVDETEWKVVRLRFRVGGLVQGRPLASVQIHDPGTLRASLDIGVYGESGAGDLARLFQTNSVVLEDKTQTAFDDFRNGAMLADSDGQEFFILMPPANGGPVTRYIACVGTASLNETEWDLWVPSTNIPPLTQESASDTNAETGRGYDLCQQPGLVLI